MSVQDRQDRITVECWDCGSESHLGDNYCSECGSPVRARLLPAIAPERRLATRGSVAVGPVLVRCAALLLAGKVVEWAVRRAATWSSLAANPVTGSVALPQAMDQPVAEAPLLPQGAYRVSALFVQELHVERPAPASFRRRFLGIL